MEHEGWHDRWQRDAIAFHEGHVNGLLERFAGHLTLSSEANVFVPLCGKAWDLHWIRQQGATVLGVELSPIAVRDFFKEAGIIPVSGMAGAFERVEGGGIALLCGDFFGLRESELAEVTAVYDRAALIALPEPTRSEYVAHGLRHLPPSVPTLLITLEYDQRQMEGPPFSVSPDAVRALYAGTRRVEVLESEEVPARRRGGKLASLDRLIEHAILLR